MSHIQEADLRVILACHVLLLCWILLPVGSVSGTLPDDSAVSEDLEHSVPSEVYVE